MGKMKIAIVLVSIQFMTACMSTGGIYGNPPGTATPDAVQPRISAPDRLPDDCIPKTTDRQVAEVTRVIDGDTIEVKMDGRTYRVRYIGMDTPEMDDSRADVRAMAKAAKEYNGELVAEKTVLMVKDTSETDQYDRLLRYIISDGVFVNNDLVQKGYAESFTYPPDVACSKIFNQAEKIARRADLGIWKP